MLNNILIILFEYPILSIMILTVLLLLIFNILRLNVFYNIIIITLGLLISLLFLFLTNIKRYDMDNKLVLDNFSIFYSSFILVSSVICVFISLIWIKNKIEILNEFYILIAISTIGSIIVIHANHIIFFILGIMLSSLPLSGMICYNKYSVLALEASIKHILLSSISSSFLIFGISLIYFQTGKLYFTDIGKYIILHQYQPIILAGISFIIVGFGLKLSMVPFHICIPDISQGAISVVTYFINTVYKISIFSLMTRFMLYTHIIDICTVNLFLKITACASILLGNLMAIKQKSLKRSLSYSSISYLGYLLIGLSLINRDMKFSSEVIGLCLFNYLIVNTGIFSIICLFSRINTTTYDDQDDILLYRGLFWKYPYLSFIFTVLLFNLSGIPLTIGFISKLYIFMLALQEKCYFLILALFVSSIIGLIFYLNIIGIICEKSKKTELNSSNNNFLFYIIPSLILIITVMFGIFPDNIIKIARSTQLF